VGSFDKLDHQILLSILSETIHDEPFSKLISELLEAGYLENGRTEEARLFRQQMQQLPSQDPNDPDFRRLKYVRYADDFLLGFIGPRSEAEEIKLKLEAFLRDHLKLDLSRTKTLITHARTE